MGTTPNFSLPYPEAPDRPAVHDDLKRLATATDTALRGATMVRPFAHMGKTDGIQQVQPPSSAGRVTMAAAQILQGGFTFSDFDDSLVVPKTGRYLLTIHFYVTGPGQADSWAGILARKNNVAMDQSKLYVTKGIVLDNILTGTCSVALSAGDRISLWAMGGESQRPYVYGSTSGNDTFLQLAYEGS